MKKKLRILLLLLSCIVLTQTRAEDVVFVFANMGFSNQQVISEVVLGDVKLNFDKGSHKTYAPTYYDSGAAIRMYQGNTLTISSTDS